jgi:hypothetical protein
LLFVRRELLAEMSKAMRDKVLPAGDQINDVSPPAFRIRKAVVRRLPNFLQHKIASLKSKLLPPGRL